MGKKSLTKSTTKKKTTTLKKTDAAKKIDTPKKAESTKKQAAAAPSKPVAPPKKTKPSAQKKPAASVKPSIESLIQKDFGTWAPASIYTPQLDPAYLKNFTAPTFIDEANADKADRIRTLLAKEFDLTVPDEPKVTPSAAPVEEQGPAAEPLQKTGIEEEPAVPERKEPIPVSELLNIKFEDWLPPALFSPVPDEAYLNNFSAPLFIETSDPKEAARIEALLFKTIDLTVVEIVEPPALEKIEIPARTQPAVAEPPPPVAPAETTEIKEPAPAPVIAKEEPVITTPVEKKEEIKPVQDIKPLEKPVMKPAPRESASQQEPPKASAPVTPAPSPAAKTPDKETEAATKAFAWAETKKPVETFDKGLNLFAGCIAVFFAFLFLASGINSGKYYLVPSEAGLEIWKGKFSPSGKQLMITVPGVELKDPLKPSYTKEEALAPAFNHYLRQADDLSAAKGAPDFEAIKVQLKNAVDVAPSENDRGMVLKRLSSIDFTFLLYKANTVSRKKTPENIEKALGFLNEAKTLDLDNAQLETLEKKINELKPPVKPANSQESPQGKKTLPEKKSGH
jgi:hypothetical protein